MIKCGWKCRGVREGGVMNRSVCEGVVKCVRCGLWGWMEGTGTAVGEGSPGYCLPSKVWVGMGMRAEEEEEVESSSDSSSVRRVPSGILGQAKLGGTSAVPDRR